MDTENEINNENLEILIDDFSNIDKDTKYLMKYVIELESLLVSLKKDLEKLKDNEIKRISREFLINDYERRFKVDIERVLSSIVGHNNIVSEMKKIHKERNLYYEKLKLCRNYDNFNSNFNITHNNLN